MKTTYAYSHCGGFTLVELMVTLIVLGILLSIGLPEFSALTAAQRQRAAASALFDSLLLARSEAITRNANVSIITTNLSSGWNVTLEDNTVLRTQRPLAGVSFAPSASAIVYNGLGRLNAGANSIQVTSHDTSACRVVSVASSGRPQISTFDDGCP